MDLIEKQTERIQKIPQCLKAFSDGALRLSQFFSERVSCFLLGGECADLLKANFLLHGVWHLQTADRHRYPWRQRDSSVLYHSSLWRIRAGGGIGDFETGICAGTHVEGADGRC